MGSQNPQGRSHAPGGEDPRSASLYDALGKHLNKVSWDHFITLTWSQPSFPPMARDCVWEYLRRLRRAQGHRFEFIYTIEFNPRSFPHAHILTTGLTETAVRSVRWWKGRKTRAHYHEGKGAAWYIGGHILRDDEVAISRNLARRVPGTHNAPQSSP